MIKKKIELQKFLLSLFIIELSKLEKTRKTLGNPELQNEKPTIFVNFETAKKNLVTFRNYLTLLVAQDESTRRIGQLVNDDQGGAGGICRQEEGRGSHIRAVSGAP